MIYVLAYPNFVRSCAEQVDCFRAKHEPQRAKLVPPHVTLVFGVKDNHLQAVTKLVDTASNQNPEFPVTFDDYAIEFDPFEQKYKIVLYCGEGSKKMTALHKKLYNGLHSVESNSADPYRPHMTIATCDERADIEQIDISSFGKLPITGTLRALELVRFVDGRLTKLITSPFRG